MALRVKERRIVGEHQGDQGQCQPSFIQCFFEKRDKEKRPHLVVEKQGRKFGVYAQKYTTGYYRIITRENTSGVSIPNYAILVSLSLMMNGRSSDSSLPVLLEDACGEVYLPQRIYAYGPYLKSKDWRWDNFSQNVYIDKNLVTYEDIDEWLDYNASQGEMAKEIRRKVKWPKERLQWKRPVSGLSKKEMKHFCSFRGKQLLEAHYYDAATFHPGDFSNVKPLKNIRGPYPWTNKSMHFFSQNLEFCSKVFTKECLSGPGGERVYEHYRKHSTSWIGMFEILGGVPEAVRNVIDPKKNLKASSYYFSADSSWHKLGMRAYWDGSAFEERNFDWIDVKKNLIEVSFRCMKFTYDL